MPVCPGRYAAGAGAGRAHGQGHHAGHHHPRSERDPQECRAHRPRGKPWPAIMLLTAFAYEAHMRVAIARGLFGPGPCNVGFRLPCWQCRTRLFTLEMLALHRKQTRECQCLPGFPLRTLSLSAPHWSAIQETTSKVSGRPVLPQGATLGAQCV